LSHYEIYDKLPLPMADDIANAPERRSGEVITRHRLNLRRYARDPAALVGLALRELRRQIPALREKVLWPDDNILDISQQDTLEALLLSYPNGAPINVLAETLRIDASTMSRIVDRCARRGLTTKERSSEDARVLLVKVTDQGAKAFGRSFWTALDRQRGLLEAEFTPRQLERLASQLVRIVEIFDDAIDASESNEETQ